MKLILVMMVAWTIFLSEAAHAQNYTSCYLNFDRNPSGKNSAGCPSRIFLTLDSAVINFVIGGPADPNDPNLVDPNLCAAGLLSPPATDDAVRDFTAQVIRDQTSLWVREVGETGLLLRVDKSAADITTCGINTNDTRLKIRSLQVNLPALFLDIDHSMDGDDDGPSGLASVTVDLNGSGTAIPVDPNDPDNKVALDIANRLETDGFLVSYGGGTGMAITHAPGGDRALIGGLTAGGNLTSHGIVPPVCFGIVGLPSGDCGDSVVLSGAGIGPGAQIFFGAEEASISLVTPGPTQQNITVVPANTENAIVSETILFENQGFDDCCPDPYTINCLTGIRRTNIQITKNGPETKGEDVELHLNTAEHPCPPAVSDCSTDEICSSGFIFCAGRSAEELATEIATELSLNCPPGITVFACGDVISILNNADISRVEVFTCLTMTGCPMDLGYGLNSDCAVNNVCNGVCNDEDQPPSAGGYNFEHTSDPICLGGLSQFIDASGDGTNMLATPRAMANDSFGNVYVTGEDSDNAFKVTPDGVITEIIDATGDGANPLDGAFGIAIDSMNNVYVSGRFSDNVFKITPVGVITQVLDATGDGGLFPLDSPRHLAMNDGDGVLVTGHDSNNLLVVSSAGLAFGLLDSLPDGLNALTGPYDVAAVGTKIYCSGELSDNVFLCDKGLVTMILDSSGDGSGNTADQPQRISFDGSENAFVACRGTDNVFKIGPGSGPTQVLDGTANGAGVLSGPVGIALDSSDNVYVSCENSNGVFKVSPEGGVSEITADFGSGAFLLTEAIAVHSDDDGNIFFVGGISDNGFKFENARIGNVNTGDGTPVDVLLVNGSPGLGADRRVTVGRTTPLQISINAPPSLPSANFAAYAYVGDASPGSTRNLPSGLGTFAMPFQITGEAIPPLLAPLEIWNTIGFLGALGTPTRAASAAPTMLIDLPGGTQRELTIYIQALIRDDNSPQGRFAVTNGVLIVSP